MEDFRHLVLVHTPGWQDLADLQFIAQCVEASAPDIKVLIATNTATCSATRKRAARRPSLIFSPIQLLAFRPDRGRIYQGQLMNKLDELSRLCAAGLPVPAYEEIRPETRLSPAIYGRFAVVKPSYELSSFGDGVELQRIDDVRFIAPTDYPENHAGHRAPMLAQKYIQCPKPMTCRVLTFFGTPIFTYLREATQPVDLEVQTGPFAQASFMPVDQELKISFTRETDFLDLAQRAYAAIPEAALQACDILRDADGKLHLLEVNPGGGTWMFSSKFAPAYRQSLGVEDLTAEFNAFSTCAQILVARTRAEAC